MSKIPPTDKALFESKCTPEPTSGCWLWDGAVTRNGYGRSNLRGRKIPAHRLSVEIYHGVSVSPGSLVRHKCDVRSCVNPDHLVLGTHADNMRDMVARNRQNHWDGRRRGERNPRAKLTAREVAEMRRKRASGMIYKDLATSYKISMTQVRNIVLGLNWSETP